MNIGQFESRKRDHVQHALDPRHQAAGLGGFDSVRLCHEALPDLNFDTVSIDARRLGKPAPTPFYVSGMTAGHADAAVINRTLAEACARRGWAMGVGSQRRDLTSPQAGPTAEWKDLRRAAPLLTLYANLGIAQIITASSDDICRVVQGLESQALAIHLNALQEVMQPEGTPQFKGGLQAIERVVRQLNGLPVIVKETGSGMSASTLRRLLDTGVHAVDVSGLGGTHWGRIEGARSLSTSIHARAAQTFATWGHSTVTSVTDAIQVLREQNQTQARAEVWGSGGVRSGLDAAKLLALGASQVGYAQPALVAALDGAEALDAWMQLQEFELRTALFCTGSATIAELSAKGVAASSPSRANSRENTSL